MNYHYILLKYINTAKYSILKIRFLILFLLVAFGNSCVLAQNSGCFKVVTSSNRIEYKLILPCEAIKITLTFSYFNVASGSFLRIYDGTDPSGTPLHPGSGFTNGNPPSTLVAVSGAMYVYFSSSGSSSKDSFLACWTSTVNSKPPVAKFEIADTIYSQVYNTFVNTSQNLTNRTEFVWNIDPGYGEVGYKKDLPWIFYTNNTYEVNLRVSKCSGTDNYKKNIAVITPNYKVNLDIQAKKTNPFLNEVDTIKGINFITKKRPVTANRFRWKFEPDKVSYVNGSSADSQNIQVKFTEKGKYNVSLTAWVKDDSSDTYNEVNKLDYITVLEPPRPKVYIEPIAKNTTPYIGETDTLYAIDSMPGKLFKANRFRWVFNPSTVTYLSGSSANMKNIAVRFNKKGKYSVKLTGWNDVDSVLTYNDTLKADYILVKPQPKVYVDFRATQLSTWVNDIDTLFSLDSIDSKIFKADRFRWEFTPNQVEYLDGTSSNSKTIHVKFKVKDNYTVRLFGWNSLDSANSYHDTIKTHYIRVMDTAEKRVYLDFSTKNLFPNKGDTIVINAIDSITGKYYRANRFNWEFSPNTVSYVNGSKSDKKNIEVKFLEKGYYSITLNGWNSMDSIGTFNKTTKTSYILVKEPQIGIEKGLTTEFVTIFPNPSTGKFTVIWANKEAYRIQIFNINGKMVKELKHEAGNNGIETIDLSNESVGLYCLSIWNTERKVVKRIAIDR